MPWCGYNASDHSPWLRVGCRSIVRYCLRHRILTISIETADRWMTPTVAAKLGDGQGTPIAVYGTYT